MSIFDDDDVDMCDDCHASEAIVHLTHVENGQQYTFHLCEACARGRGLPIPDGATLMKGLEALAGAGGSPFGNAQVKVMMKPFGGGGPVLAHPAAAQAQAQPQEDRREEDVECSGCGLKLSEFRMNGRLGCAECYASFDEQVERMLVQLHGAGGHCGKKYRGGGRTGTGGKKDLERMRADLDTAVKGQDFERAAVLRDAIRGLERSVK